jgi:hypothetical protein
MFFMKKKGSMVEHTTWAPFRTGWWVLHAATIPVVYLLGRKMRQRK